MSSEPPPPRRLPSIAVPWDPRDAVTSMLLLLGVNLVAQVIAGAIIGVVAPDRAAELLRQPEILIATTLFLQVTLVAAAFLLGPARYRVGWSFLGFTRTSMGRVLAWAAVAFALNIAFNIVYGLLLKEFAPSAVPEPLPPELQNANTIVLIVAVALGAPIAEEVYFRGFLFQGLAGSLGVAGAASASALLFGVVHALSGIAVIPVALFAGVVFALVFRRTGSIWPSLLAHLAQNSIALYSVLSMPEG
ncbi:MAG: CPBP family intramembrane metalloprotease [SAR202 cluster bacterium]|nr:CPBP family intramembrane metalloprotease [SAR202 cluster bacterium]